MEAMLLLARGACIETFSELKYTTKQKSCSSQEEHVLKLFYGQLQRKPTRVAPRKRSMY